MTSFESGRKAEDVAAVFLGHHGCTIIGRNWRTRWCEIDILARRQATIYFCEVKYRRQHYQGSGVDCITPQKLRQMQFAAEFWLATHKWPGLSRLCVIEVSGPAFKITAAIKLS